MDGRGFRGAVLGLAGLSGGLCTGAWAQQAPPADAGDAQSKVLPEVVVTARKRQERLRDVPIAASVITGNQRRALVLDNMDDYLRQVPSTNLVSSGPEYLNDVSIRGQGSGRLGFSETATGLFRDGMYKAGGGFGGRSLSRMDLFDFDRIEVMRGPQGALYGRNSVGGAINVIANHPDRFFEASGTARAGTTERTDFEGIVSGPLTAALGARLGGFYDDQNGGFIHNLTTGNIIDAQHYRGARSVLDYKPGTRLDTSLLYEYYDSTAPGFANLGERPTRVDGTRLDPGPYERADMNREGDTAITEHSALLSADYSMARAKLSFKLNYGYRNGSRSNEDVDHFAGESGINVVPGTQVIGPDFTVGQFENYHHGGAQLYLASAGSTALNWLAGVEALRSDSDVNNDPTDCPAYTGSVQADTPGCFVGHAGTLNGVSAQVRSGARLGVNHDHFSEQLASYSVFGSLDWRVLPRLRLGLELRVQRDLKDFDFERFSEDPLAFFGSTSSAPPAGLMPVLMIASYTGGAPQPVQFCPPWLAAGQCAPGLQTARLGASRHWTFWTPAATVHYALTRRQALYLRYATGTRPGGFNSNLPPTTVRSDLQSELLYEPEHASSYEAGWKGDLLGGRIEGDADIFYTDTRDVQVVTAPSSLSRGFVLQNTRGSYVYGAELELRHLLHLGHARLTTSLAASTQSGQFKSGSTALLDLNGDGVPEQADLSGNDVPRLRNYDLTLNLVYSTPLVAGLRASVGTSVQAAQGGYQTPDNSAQYDGYALVDVRVGLQRGHWKFSLYGHNLSDDRYVLNIVSGNYFWSDPRTYGAELTAMF